MNPDALQAVCSRLEDFHSVHKNKGWANMVDSMKVLRKGFGLDDDTSEWFCEWVREFCGEPYEAPMLLGLLIGIMAEEYE